VNIQGFEFRFGSKDGALNAANRLLRSRAIYAQAWQRGDQATIAQMDPFFECSLSNQWTAPPEQRGTGPQTPVVPKAARNARWLGALGFGLVTAAVTYLVVDNVFDDDRKALDGRSHPRTAKKKKTSDDD
jgi:hypothetical protein